MIVPIIIMTHNLFLVLVDNILYVDLHKNDA